MSGVAPAVAPERPRPRAAIGTWRVGRSGPAAALAAAPALAAALGAYQLAGRSLGFDEGATVAIASQHGSALWSAIAHDGGNMSGYYLLVHLLIGAFGDGVVVLRLPSVVATVATVALVQAVADRLFGRRVALASGVLTAVSLPLVYWAQTARAYAPMVAFVCAAYLALVALAEGRESRRGAWVGYVAAMTLAMYCSLIAVLVVPAQLLVLARRRRALRSLAAALVAVGVLCAPLAALAAARGSGQLFWVPRPTRMVETQVMQSLTSAGLAPSFHHVTTTYTAMWATVGAVVAALALAAWRARSGRDAWGLAVVLAWCALPAGLTFLWSFALQPIFVPRNLIASTPAVGLTLAAAGGSLVGAARRRAPAIAAAVVALGLALVARAVPLAASYGASPEPWRQVAASVIARSAPGDCVAFYPRDARMAFQYYVVRTPDGVARAPRPILPALAWGQVRPYVESYVVPPPRVLARRFEGCRRLWLVTSHEGQPDGPAAARAHRERWIALDVALERRLGIGPMVSYGYASRIHVQLLGGR